MLYKTLSAAVYGIDANIIEVEVDVSGIKCDEDHFHTVGLPDAAAHHALYRDQIYAPGAEQGSIALASVVLTPIGVVLTFAAIIWNNRSPPK